MATRTEILTARYTTITARLEKYRAAETAILDGAQSYSIGSRTLTRAHLDTITNAISRLEREQLKLINSNIRLQRVVPRNI